MGQQVSAHAEYQHHQWKRNPSQLHSPHDFLEEEIVDRTDQQDVEHHQRGNDPKRHQLDAAELVRATVQLARQIGVAEPRHLAQRVAGDIFDRHLRPAEQFIDQLFARSTCSAESLSRSRATNTTSPKPYGADHERQVGRTIPLERVDAAPNIDQLRHFQTEGVSLARGLLVEPVLGLGVRLDRAGARSGIIWSNRPGAKRASGASAARISLASRPTHSTIRPPSRIH